MSSGRRRRRPAWRWVLVLLVITLVGWWWLGGDGGPVVPENSDESTTIRRPQNDLDDLGPAVVFEPPTPEETEKPAGPTTSVPPSPTAPPATIPTRREGTAAAALQRAVQLLGTDPAQARRELTLAWLAGLDDVSRATAITHARRLASVTLLDCREPDGSPFLTARTVAPDESLGLIRQRDSIRFGIDFLATVNGLDDPNRIKAGQVLRIPRGDFDAVVDLSSRDLAIFQNTGDRRDLLLVVPIEIGRVDSTPTGDFRVRTAAMRRRHHRIGLEPRRPEDRGEPAVQGLELVARTDGGAADGRSIRLAPEDAALVYELLGSRDAATVEIRE